MSISKCSLLLLLSLAALSLQVEAQLTMEQALLRFFEHFRCRMIYEQDNINLPRLEPYKEDEFELEFESESLGSMKILTRNLTVEGLSTFHVPDLIFDLFSLNFNITLEVPKLSVSGWYSLSGELQDLIELRGSGDFALTMEGIRIFMDGQQGHDGEDNTWWLNRLSLDFSLAKMSGFMNGIMEDEVLEDFFNYILNNAMPEMIEAVFPELEPEMVKIAKEMVPELLNGTPLIDVINIIFLDQEFLMPLPEGVECPLEEPV